MKPAVSAPYTKGDETCESQASLPLKTKNAMKMQVP